MKYHVMINEKTKEGKKLLSIIKKMPKKTVEIVEDNTEESLIPAEEVFLAFKAKLKAEYEKRSRKSSTRK